MYNVEQIGAEPSSKSSGACRRTYGSSYGRRRPRAHKQPFRIVGALTGAILYSRLQIPRESAEHQPPL